MLKIHEMVLRIRSKLYAAIGKMVLPEKELAAEPYLRPQEVERMHSGMPMRASAKPDFWELRSRINAFLIRHRVGSRLAWRVRGLMALPLILPALGLVATSISAAWEQARAESRYESAYVEVRETAMDVEDEYGPEAAGRLLRYLSKQGSAGQLATEILRTTHPTVAEAREASWFVDASRDLASIADMLSEREGAIEDKMDELEGLSRDELAAHQWRAPGVGGLEFQALEHEAWRRAQENLKNER